MLKINKKRRIEFRLFVKVCYELVLFIFFYRTIANVDPVFINSHAL